jgi:hypothetical protein
MLIKVAHVDLVSASTDRPLVVFQVADRLQDLNELPERQYLYNQSQSDEEYSPEGSERSAGEGHRGHLQGEVDSVYGDHITCRACTYHNSGDRANCEICEAPLQR